MTNKHDIYEKGDNSMVETPQELINRTIERVEMCLVKYFPDFLAFEKGTYTISRGSIQVLIVVRPFTENETCIEFISNVVSNANITPELMEFLLRKNTELHYGAFGLLFDGTIVFQHSIAGSNVDENEFKTSLNAVAIISDYYDSEIIKMAGGQRPTEIDEEIF